MKTDKSPKKDKMTTACGKLRSLSIGIPAWCDLYCPYCYKAAKKIDHDKNYLTLDEYRKLIGTFAEMGGREVLISGDGEPFHHNERMGVSNRRLTLDILECCKEKGLAMTIFTTAHWIDAELANRLVKYDLILKVKYNSMDEDIQNRLVGIKDKNKQFNYALQRDHALLILMAAGFNTPGFGKKSRLGIDPNILNDNKDELPTLLRFARRNNLIFSCDTIMERGRGKSFNEGGNSPSDGEITEIYQTLRRIDAEEFGNQWPISRSVLGNYCDRYQSFIFVSKTGDVHPCVGSTPVLLGNIRFSTLQECWDSPARKVIRNLNYTGKCTKCSYFKVSCYPCLSRCTENLSNERIEADGYVQTTGCWNFHPISRK